MDSMDDSGIKWGEPIEITDKRRPEWLDRDIRLKWAIIEHDGSYGVWQNSWSQETQNWTGLYKGVVIRLPADHPHYQKQAESPKVDWTKPIEAVHVDGRVAPAIFRRLSSTGDSALVYCQETEDNGEWWYDAHDPSYKWNGWTIRNVRPPEPAPAIDPALVERMWLLIERMAQADKQEVAIMGTGQREAYEEARDILKALEPVDLDVAIAEEIAASFNEGEHEAIALAALKRGRQLERELRA